MRLILLLALGGVLFLIYQAWVTDYGPASRIESTYEAPASPTDMRADTPASGSQASVTDAVMPPSDAPDAPPAATPMEPALSAAGPAVNGGAAILAPIVVETDVIRVDISPRGGTIESMWLLDYAQTSRHPDQPYRLFKPEPPNMFIAQTGLLGDANTALPTHNSLFTAAQTSFALAEGSDELTVELRWAEGGVEVIKRYQFRRGSFEVIATQQVINNTDLAIAVRDYDQLQRTELIDPTASSFIYTYTGGVYFGPEINYKKESFDDMRKRRLDLAVTDGWVAMIQHYFVAAWVPPPGITQTFYTKVVEDGPRYIIGNYSPSVIIRAGESHTFESRLFAGPKVQDQLGKVAPGLKLTVDYGWLTILADPIFWLLNKIHSLVGNWGWSIIILTILIKLAFYKLSETSYKSMAHLRQVTPRMQALKDRYGDDKERLNQAMMELYKKEKINPLGGCLPILVQIPVFIALYWVLLESVELRHAPFILWLDNLTEPDPLYILPLIMGVSMYVQQKLNPPPPDPMQAKIMMTLPFVFTVFFAFFPSGLVLYWTVNNLLSIAQQWYITRQIEKKTPVAAGKKGG